MEIHSADNLIENSNSTGHSNIDISGDILGFARVDKKFSTN